MFPLLVKIISHHLAKNTLIYTHWRCSHGEPTWRLGAVLMRHQAIILLLRQCLVTSGGLGGRRVVVGMALSGYQQWVQDGIIDGIEIYSYNALVGPTLRDVGPFWAHVGSMFGPFKRRANREDSGANMPQAIAEKDHACLEKTPRHFGCRFMVLLLVLTLMLLMVFVISVCWCNNGVVDGDCTEVVWWCL